VLPLLRGLVESQDHEFLVDSAAGMYRVRARASARPVPAVPPPLSAAARRQGGVELHVIPLQHARAADVASTINALYGRGGGAGVSGGRMPTLAEELRGNLVPPAGEAAPPAPGGSGDRTASLSGDVTIVADPRGNSLLVRADAQDLALVTGVVQALDVRPLQVLIEVIVAEVRRDRSLGLSAEAELQPTGVGRNGAQIQGTAGAAGLGDFALQVMGLGGLDLEATLRAAASRGDVRILTRPVVLATNNQLAEIVVGSQRPFVQVQRSLPTDAAARDQIVQYKDVGTRLSVRPTISRDGSVQLDVTQEVSTATAEVAFNAPVIATRSIQTQLLVTDGQTVALGGLTDRVREARQQGIPILSSIPLLGGLFGAASRQTIETELFIFLTPRVIRTDEDASRFSQPLQDRAKVTP
jgi:general secretion pathway protein D